MPDPALAALTRRITEALGETNPHLVRRVVEVIGPEAATAHYIEAQRIEAAGGELIASGKRRRTPGGVFFRLVRDAATVEQRQAIGWPTGAGETGQPSARERRPHSEIKVAPLPWETRLAHLQALLDEKGTVNMSKLTLTGRPGKMIEAQDCILTVMATDPGKAPTLPKGLPLPPAQPTKYIVYIAAKQWQKVAEAIQDPGDVLIVEGYPIFDERLPGLAVLTQNITTRNLQRAKRAAEAGSTG